MKSGSIIDSLLLSNPFHRGMGECLILVGTGIYGLVFSWANFSIFPVSNIIGGLLILSAFVFHSLLKPRPKGGVIFIGYACSGVLAWNASQGHIYS